MLVSTQEREKEEYAPLEAKTAVPCCSSKMTMSRGITRHAVNSVSESPRKGQAKNDFFSSPRLDVPHGHASGGLLIAWRVSQRECQCVMPMKNSCLACSMTKRTVLCTRRVEDLCCWNPINRKDVSDEASKGRGPINPTSLKTTHRAPYNRSRLDSLWSFCSPRFNVEVFSGCTTSCSTIKNDASTTM